MSSGFQIFSIALILYLEFRLMKVSFKLSGGTLLNPLYVLYYFFQGILGCVIIVLDPDFTLGNNNSLIIVKLTDSILPYCWGSLLAIAGIVCGMYLSNRTCRYIIELSWSELVSCLSNVYNISIVSSFFLVGFWFSIFNSLFQNYLVSVIFLTFAFSPMLIGLLWDRLGRISRGLWLISLVFSLIVHTVQGSRGYAMFPLFAFGAGYLLMIRSDLRRFRKTVKWFIIMAIAFIPFLSFVQDYREAFGRGRDISLETLAEMFDYAGRRKKNDLDKGIYSSWGRLLNHPDNVVVSMSPNLIPFRGAEFMSDEIISIFSVLGEAEAEQFRKERNKLGYSTGVATMYGFNVDESTSVEFSLFADAYSRFGYIGIFIYFLIYAMILSLLEKWCYNQWRKTPLLAVILTLFFLYNGALNYSYSYYSLFKVILFRGMLVIALTYILSVVSKRMIVRV